MATRRTSTANPAPPVLTIDQKRRRIEQLRACIKDIEGFDPQTVQKRYGIPEVIALEAGIDDALSAAFGHKTPSYERYSGAATLDMGPHIAKTDWDDGGLRDVREAREYLADGKVRSIALLRQAVRAIENDLADHVETTQGLVQGNATVGQLRKVFVVHGRDEGARETVAGFLRKIDIEPIILHEQANQGRTVIEKMEAHGDVPFAVVLLTPDDTGSEKGGLPQPRARQNVVLELGYFVGRLGRKNVCALKRGDLEIPSDFVGVVYENYDSAGAWKTALGRELEAAGYAIDWNIAMR